MTVFSNLQSAKRFGFQWFDDDQQLKLHIVVRDFQGKDGMRRRELALARPDEAAALAGSAFQREAQEA